MLIEIVFAWVIFDAVAMFLEWCLEILGFVADVLEWGDVKVT